jgi:photosystem II stability/assembly factor-like uncharacterized protein
MIPDWRSQRPIAPGGTIFGVSGHLAADWLAGPAGIFRQRDNGWQIQTRGIPFWRVNTVLARDRLVWAAGMPEGIVRSTDDGQSWFPCLLDELKAPVFALIASPNYARDRVLLAATDGDGILRSTDAGRSWVLSNFGLREFSILDIALAPHWDRYEYAFAITEAGIYQSPNGGRAWRSADLPDPDLRPAAVALDPDFENNRTVWAGCEGGELLVSTDAGRHFSLAARPADDISALAFTASGNLLVATFSGLLRLANPALADGTAEIVLQDLPILSLAEIAGTLYAGSIDGLFASSDDGGSWTQDQGLSARRFTWFEAPQADFWLAAGPEAGLWRSRDRETWELCLTESPILGIAARGIEIWASTVDGLLSSPDGGASWKTAGLDDVECVALAASPDKIWVGDAASHIWYANAGGTWNAVETPFAGRQLLSLHSQGEQLVAAVWDPDSAAVQLWRTTFNAREWTLWQSLSGPTAAPKICFLDPDGEQALVALGSDLHFTAGRGEAQWKRQTLSTAGAPLTVLLAHQGQVVAATVDRVIRSADGITWEDLPFQFDGHPLQALIALPDGTFFAASIDGRIWLA